MADLNRYLVRMQSVRTINISAQNALHASNLARDEVRGMEDTDIVVVLWAERVADNVGTEDGKPLHSYDVAVRFRRNFLTSAVDEDEAVYWAREDMAAWEDTSDVTVVTQVLYVKGKVGITA